MAEKFLMPKLSPTMDEGQIARWVKNEGESYEANETLAEVDTDKATMEMTALTGGTLLKILKVAGESAALGEAIAIIGKAGEDISALLSEVASNGSAKVEEAKSTGVDETPPTKVETRAVASESSIAAAPVVASKDPQSEIVDPQSNGGRIIVSPIAARMAAENGVDLKSIAGTGPNGRIIKRDVEAAMIAPVPSKACSFRQRAERSTARAAKDGSAQVFAQARQPSIVCCMTCWTSAALCTLGWPPAASTKKRSWSRGTRARLVMNGAGTLVRRQRLITAPPTSRPCAVSVSWGTTRP